MAFNPLTSTVYVANFGTSSVSLISASTNKVTSTITAGQGPAGVAANPLTATAYITNFDDGTASVTTN